MFCSYLVAEAAHTCAFGLLDNIEREDEVAAAAVIGREVGDGGGVLAWIGHLGRCEVFSEGLLWAAEH